MGEGAVRGGSLDSLTRRRLLKLGAGAAAGVTCAPLFACGSSERSSTSLVQWEADSRDRALAAARWWASEFANANGELKVETSLVPPGTEPARLRARRGGSGTPDVIRSYETLLTSYRQGGLVLDLRDLIDDIGRDRFLTRPLESITFSDGSIYSVPMVGYPYVVYYRKDLYERAGLKEPTTHADLLSNARELHDPPNTYGFSVYNGKPTETQLMDALMATYGAYFFDADNRLALERPETLKAWQFYKDLGALSPPGSMAQGDLESRDLIQKGKVAHALSSTSFAGGLPDEDLDLFGAFPVPKEPGAKGAGIDFMGNTIPTKAPHVEEAKAMISFLMTKPNIYQGFLNRTIVCWLPMLKDAYTSEYFSNPVIAKRREFIEVGRRVLEDGVFSANYFGASEKVAALQTTDIEKSIGDRLVLQKQSSEEVLKYAVDAINSRVL
jgi:multiple sugar transport system substrate-binding protein